MKKIIFILMSILPCLCCAQKVNLQKYLKGQLPMQNGQVVFEKDFQVAQKSQAQIYDLMLSYVKQLVKNSKHDDYSKLTLQDADKGLIVANVQELMYFKHKAWNADCTDFFYRILVSITSGKVNVKVQDITYNYEGDTGLKAERWITDKYALTKDGKDFRKDTGKFRRLTMDRAGQILEEAEQAVK